MNNLLIECIIAFTSQYAFLYFRTLNIYATSKLNVRGVMLTGAAINLLWLIGIAIGAKGAQKVMLEYDWTYIPVVLCILTGSLLGTYVSLKKKIAQSTGKKRVVWECINEDNQKALTPHHSFFNGAQYESTRTFTEKNKLFLMLVDEDATETWVNPNNFKKVII